LEERNFDFYKDWHEVHFFSSKFALLKYTPFSTAVVPESPFSSEITFLFALDPRVSFRFSNQYNTGKNAESKHDLPVRKTPTSLLLKKKKIRAHKGGRI
jgi:hypothetical protein